MCVPILVFFPEMNDCCNYLLSCNRNVHKWSYFCNNMVHCGIWSWCIVGFVQLSLDLCNSCSHLSYPPRMEAEIKLPLFAERDFQNCFILIQISPKLVIRQHWCLDNMMKNTMKIHISHFIYVQTHWSSSRLPDRYQGALLLTWFTFNPSMDK